jgi:GTPase SAR1 family protein
MKKALILIVVGQTDSGKTTLLNEYINYILGINYVNYFRNIQIK